MKIIFNTQYPDAPASLFYASGLSGLKQVCFSDRDHLDQYDIALFMTYKKDIQELIEVKKKHPRLKVGLIDPRGSQIVDCLGYVDFFIVDSLEMKDYFAGYGLPILSYSEYPDIKTLKKKHKKKEPIIIGYHGNMLHLAGMYPHLTTALEKLAEKYPLELWAMYNINKQGKCRLGIPKNLPVKHIQWSLENYEKILSRADIGIVPNLMPIRKISSIKKKASLLGPFFNDNDDDYLTRYKMPSNPGRIIVFGKMGIPVVSDFYPSALQLIRDGENGLLACSTGGWYRALEKLIENVDLRQELSDAMQKTILCEFEYEVQNKKAAAFFKRIIERRESSGLSVSFLGTKKELDRSFTFWIKIFQMKVEQVFRKILSIVFNKKR